MRKDRRGVEADRHRPPAAIIDGPPLRGHRDAAFILRVGPRSEIVMPDDLEDYLSQFDAVLKELGILQ